MANSEYIKKVTFTNIDTGETVQGLTTPGGYCRTFELCDAAKKAGRLSEPNLYMTAVGLTAAYYAAKRLGITEDKDTTTLDDVYDFFDKYDAELEMDAKPKKAKKDGKAEVEEDPTSVAPEDPSATS